MPLQSYWLNAAYAAAAALLIFAAFPASAADPIKIGLGMSLTGKLANNGKMALLGMQIWEDDTNAAAACSAGRSSSSTMTIRAIRRRCPASTPSSLTSTKST